MQRRGVGSGVVVASIVVAFLLGMGVMYMAAPMVLPQNTSTTTSTVQSSTVLQGASIMLDWTVLSYHTPILLANWMGFDKANGVSLQVEPGSGSVNTVETVSGGGANFGFADISAVVLGAARGYNTTIVAGLYPYSQYGIWYRADEIKAPSDLQGKNMCYTPGGIGEALFPAFAQQTGVSQSSVHITDVSASSLNSLLGDGKCDFIASTVVAAKQILSAAQQAGLPASDFGFWPYKNYGIKLASYVLITNPSLVKNNPQLVKATVQTILQSFDYYGHHFNQTEGTFFQKYPEQDKGSIPIDNATVYFEGWNTSPRPVGFGQVSNDQLQQSISVITSAYNLNKTLSPSQLYNGSFLPTGWNS